MKKIIAIVLAMVLLLVSSLVLGGCGISEEVYNAVVAERDAAQAQVTTLQSDLSSSQAQITTLESDLSTAQAQITTLESDLSTAQAQTTTLESDLSTAESRVTTLESDLDAAEAEFQSFKSGLTPAWTSLEKKLDVALPYLLLSNETDKLDYGLITEEKYNELLIDWLLGMGPFIDAVGDAQLSEYWQDFWSYSAQEDVVSAALSLVSWTDLLVDLVTDDFEIMKSKLAR